MTPRARVFAQEKGNPRATVFAQENPVGVVYPASMAVRLATHSASAVLGLAQNPAPLWPGAMAVSLAHPVKPA